MECCSGTKEEFDPARLQSRIAPGNGPTLGMVARHGPEHRITFATVVSYHPQALLWITML
jgi:hypothetical protein